MPWPTVPIVTTGMDADADGLPRADILDLTTKFNQLIAMRGVADGVCDLDASALIPVARIPAAIARLASPALSGTPTAPTATAGTNTTQLATTAFVLANGGGGLKGETIDNGARTVTFATDNAFVLKCTVAGAVYTFPTGTAPNEGAFFWTANDTSSDTGLRVYHATHTLGGAAAGGTTIYVPSRTIIGWYFDGANWQVFEYSGKTVWKFTASGTWYCPPGINIGLGTVVGGGGGGFGNTVGGSTGGTSSIGALLSAAGGAGSTNSTTVASLGGVPNGFSSEIEGGGDGPFGRGGKIAGVRFADLQAAIGFGVGGWGNLTGTGRHGGGGGFRIREPITPVPGTAYAITVGAGGLSGDFNGEAGTIGLVIVEVN